MPLWSTFMVKICFFQRCLTWTRSSSTQGSQFLFRWVSLMRATASACHQSSSTSWRKRWWRTWLPRSAWLSVICSRFIFFCFVCFNINAGYRVVPHALLFLMFLCWATSEVILRCGPFALEIALCGCLGSKHPHPKSILCCDPLALEIAQYGCLGSKSILSCGPLAHMWSLGPDVALWSVGPMWLTGLKHQLTIVACRQRSTVGRHKNIIVGRFPARGNPALLLS